MKKFLALVLPLLCLAFPYDATADTDFGVFPGMRLGLGRGTYRGIDAIDAKPANGQPSWASFYEFHLDSIVVFGNFVGVGISGSYLKSSISNPSNDIGNDFAYSGWGVTGIGMISIVERLFVSVRAGGVFGTVEAYNSSTKSEHGSTGLRLGGGITYALMNNDVGTLGLSLNVDRLASGKVTMIESTDATFASTVGSLGVTFAMNLD